MTKSDIIFLWNCRYGRVQSVKLLPRTVKDDDAGSQNSGGGSGGLCAAVAFMDIKSAAKAHASENSLDDRNLVTDYYEPLLHCSDTGSSGASAVATSTTPVASLRSSRYSNHDDVLAAAGDSGGGGGGGGASGLGGGAYERGSSHFFERRGADPDGPGMAPGSYLRRQQAPSLHYRDRQGNFFFDFYCFLCSFDSVN